MLVGLAAMMLAFPYAQEPLQLNVPYSCQDGITRVVTRCEKNARGGEVCFWREEQNGQVNERFNVRGQMDGWLRTCRAPAAQPAATPNVQSAGRPGAPPAAPATRPGQPLNPPYLAGMPSPDIVMQRIQGNGAVDTLARQITALGMLTRIIERMRMSPTRGYNLTPDEQQLENVYNLAAYQLSQNYAKSAGPAAAKTLEQTAGRYDFDPALRDQVTSLLSPAALADYRTVDRGANAQAQARADQQRREAEQARTPAASPGNATGMRNDPGTIAMRRCLELGGGPAECLGNGITTGFADFIGFNPAAIGGPPKPAGLRIGGDYTGPTSVVISFAYDNANLHQCGKLVSDARAYSVAKRGDQLQVQIDNQPQPLVISLGPDGRFTGPAAFDITGQVIVGYNTYWVEERRVSDNTIIPGSGHQERTPIYEPRTERCAFASLRPTGPTQADVSILGAATGALGGQANPAAARSGTETAPAGPRIRGTYVGAEGLRIEFQPTAVVLDCAEAHVMRPYDVQNLADRVVVTVRNANVPLTLTLRPDGMLAGAGSVEVAGRRVTGVNNAGDATFAPVTTRCAVSTLKPQ